MQHYRLYFLVISSLVLLACSRNKCEGQYDCTDLTGVEFRVLRTTDGTDLVFGPNRLYDKNGFKFYTLTGLDTTFFDYHLYYATHGTMDSTIGVTFPRGTATAYVRLSNGDVDTLAITYRSHTTNCGCTTTNISTVRVNNVTEVQGPGPLVQLRK